MGPVLSRDARIRVHATNVVCHSQRVWAMMHLVRAHVTHVSTVLNVNHLRTTFLALRAQLMGPTTSELRSFPKSEWQHFSISVRVNKSPDRIGLPKATRFNKYSWHIILDVGKTSSLCGAQRRRISLAWWPKGLAAVEKAPIWSRFKFKLRKTRVF